MKKPQKLIKITKCGECLCNQYQAIGDWWMCAYPMTVGCEELTIDISHAVEEEIVSEYCPIVNQQVILDIQVSN